MWRLFVAVLVPEEVIRNIAAAQGKLQSLLTGRSLTWTRPEQFHLTLKFLGNVDPSRADALAVALRQACSRFRPFQVAARGVGFFPGSKRPRVLWAGLDAANGILVELHQAVEVAAQPFTNEKPENRFHAHVTIARVRQCGAAENLLMNGWAEQYEQQSFGKWIVSEAALVRSQLSPKGATYTRVAGLPFEG